MTNESVAPRAPETAGQNGQPDGQPDKQPRIPDYAWRGMGIFAAAQDLILGSYQGGGRWLVPSGSDPGRHYEIRTGTRPARNRCECRGFGTHGHCSHLVAASRVAKGSAVCDSCGVRRWWRDLVEVAEDDGSLTWFPGDRLCRACVAAMGGIS